MKALERIVVRLPNWLGDVVLARPLLAAVGRAHPDACVHAVAPEGLLTLLTHEGLWQASDAWPRGDGARSALAAHLRAWRPDAALVLPGSFSSALLAWRCAAPVRIGFRSDARGWLLTHALPRLARGERHLSMEFLDLGAVIGARSGPTPALRPEPAARAGAQALLARVTGHAPERYAVLAPRTAYGPAREWPLQRFAHVGRFLRARGLAVVVCGTAAERPTCDALAEAIGAGAVSLAGETPLPELLAVLADATVVMGNDSGIAHVAAATGTPTVVVFSSASSAWTAPGGPRVRIVQHAPPCSPCYQRTCRIGYRCLTDVTPDAVERACADVGA